MKRFLVATLSASTSLLHAFAVAEDMSPRTLEEIMVTAQRTSQSLQDVPISISVVSADDIARNSIFDFRDTADLTPGVTFGGGAAALASITVRGVGPGFFAPTAQSVPIFVDEIPAVQPGVVFNTMVDIARVELLRGPQGTLYGKNAPSGAYNITTVAPSFDKVEGYVTGSYSQWDATDEPTTDIRGAVNAPITDTLAVRFAGVYADSDGGIVMASPFATDDYTGGKDHRSLRARLLWEPSDTSQVHLISNYQDLDDTYSLRLFDGLVPGTGGTSPLDAIYTGFSDREDFATQRSGSTTEVKDIALKYQWQGDEVNVDFVLARQYFDTTLFQDQSSHPIAEPDGTPVQESTDFTLENEQTTMELRASNSSDSFDYVAGIFVNDSEGESETIIEVQGTPPLPALVTVDSFGAAVFGNFTFHLADQWDLSAGFRYEDNKQDYTSFVDLSGFEGNLDESLEFNHLSWSFKLNCFLNEDATAYLAIDNAYRQGGTNSYAPAIEAVGAALGNPAIIETAQAFRFYDEEVSTSFEMGIKGTAFEDKMRYSLAVFYQEFDDHIIRQNSPSSDDIQIINALYTLMFVNAEEVTTSGVEFDVTYLLSARWTLDFRSAYFDAEVGEWENRLCKEGDVNEQNVFCPARSGSELSQLSKLNTNIQLTYFMPLDSGWNLYSTASWTWKSEPAENTSVTDHYNESLSFLNLNVGLSNETFSFIVWGKNLTDEQSLHNPTQASNGDPDLPSALSGSHNNSLQYGLTVGYNF